MNETKRQKVGGRSGISCPGFEDFSIRGHIEKSLEKWGKICHPCHRL